MNIFIENYAKTTINECNFMLQIVKWWQYMNVGGPKAQCEIKEMVIDCETRKLIPGKNMLNVDNIIEQTNTRIPTLHNEVE